MSTEEPQVRDLTVNTLTDDKIITSLIDWCNLTKEGSQNYCIVTNDGLIHRYTSRPCYGEMRPYFKTHPKEVSKDTESMPSDLNIRFPDGNPIGIAVGFSRHSLYHENSFLFDKESLFSSIFDYAIKVYDKEKQITGIVMTSTYFDPTLFVNALISRRYISIPPRKVTGILSIDYVLNTLGTKGTHIVPTLYYMSPFSSIKHVLERTPYQNLSYNHDLFYDRAVYNRKFNERSFVAMDKKTGTVDPSVPNFYTVLTNAIRENRIKIDSNNTRTAESINEVMKEYLK